MIQICAAYTCTVLNKYLMILERIIETARGAERVGRWAILPSYYHLKVVTHKFLLDYTKMLGVSGTDMISSSSFDPAPMYRRPKSR